jgi:hypothetical protein
MNREELFDHLTEDKRFSLIGAILAAEVDDGSKLSPDEFITQESYRAIAAYMRVHKYGINSLYAPGEVPESFMQACDTIQNALDKIESDKLKAMKDK